MIELNLDYFLKMNQGKLKHGLKIIYNQLWYSTWNIKILIDLTFQTKGMLTDLPQGVYCIDNDKNGTKPYMAVGSKSKIYIIKPEKDF